MEELTWTLSIEVSRCQYVIAAQQFFNTCVVGSVRNLDKGGSGRKGSILQSVRCDRLTEELPSKQLTTLVKRVIKSWTYCL